MVIQVPQQFEELPGVRRGRVDNPMSGTTAGDIAARQATQTGRALSGAGDVVAQIAQQEQDKANKIRLNDAFNQASAIAHELRYGKDSGYLRLKGADAVKGIQADDGSFRPITESYGETLNKRLADIRKNLGNETLAAQFDLASGDLATKFRNEAVSYEAEQASVYAVQVQDATIQTVANALAVDPFGKDATFQRNRAVDAAVAKARAAGLQGKVVADANGKMTWEKDSPLGVAVDQALGKMHTAVVSSLLDSKDVAGAKRYFESHGDDFGALDRKDIKAKLDTAWSAAQAIGIVDEVLLAHPLILNQPANRKDMDAALRAHYKDDPEGLKAARAELSQRISDHEFQETEANAGNVSGVWNQLLGGASMAQVESSRAWLSLPGDERARLKSAWDNHQSSTIPDEAWADWLGLMMDPNALADATSAQLAAMEPFYGRTLTMQLVNQSAKLKAERAGDAKAAAMASPKIDTDLFQSIATTYGLPAYSDDLNDAQRKSLAIFRSQLETVVAQQQAATGKVIPPADMPDFLRKAAARIQDPNTTAARWLGGMSPALQGKIPVQLPAAGTPESAALARYLQAKGLPPTIENQRRAMIDLMDAGSYLVDE